MTAALIRSMLMTGLKSRFEGFEYLLAKIDDNTVIVKCAKGVLSEKADQQHAELKRLKLLGELLGLKIITSLYVESKRDTIVIQGSDKDNNKKEIVL